MTIGEAPDWINSPYIYVNDEGALSIKEDAPKELKEKFKKFIDEV